MPAGFGPAGGVRSGLSGATAGHSTVSGQTFVFAAVRVRSREQRRAAGGVAEVR